MLISTINTWYGTLLFYSPSMHIKEPYYDNDLTTKSPLCLTADLLKIPPSTDFPVSVSLNTPILRSSLRRGSMEPYYKTSSRRSTMAGSSTLSSYALLSDVFDYHYTDHYSHADHENAIVSDSDTDYDELDEVHHGVSNSGREVSDSGHGNFESDTDSDLEDYKVHFLTFKVTSRAQFTHPPRRSQSNVSDHFDDGPAPKDFSFVSTLHHPKFAAPPLNPRTMNVDSLDDSVAEIVANYELQCSNPLLTSILDQNVSQKPEVVPVGVNEVSDLYSGVAPKIGTSSDAYDTTKVEDFVI